MDFPDYSAQEEIISTSGDAELLYKHGVKTVRYKKTYWTEQGDKEKYELIKYLMKGKVLDVGMGAANSTKMILKKGVTSLKSFELIQDLVDLYNLDPESGNHSIKLKNFHANKPIGKFDVILYELSFDSQASYDEASAFLDWAVDHLENGGKIIIPFDKYSNALVKTRADYSYEYISNETMRSSIIIYDRKFIKLNLE